MDGKLLNKAFTILAALLFITVFVFDDAYARAGGSTSSGSRGSRSYSSPSKSTETSSPTRQVAPTPSQAAPASQPFGGGFMRGIAGGLIGGLVGSMLFSSLGFAGQGGFGGSGIGLIEILLLLGLGYFIFRMIRKRKEEVPAYQTPQASGYQAQVGADSYKTAVDSVANDRAAGISYIRQMDAGFDEARFKDTAMDIFFKVQAAWMNRSLTPVSSMLTDEMRGIFQGDLDRLIKEKKINRLDNIAVRNVEVTEVWQETGQDFITVLIHANLLDYTVDESNNEVVSGSRTEPVKFEEYWTFTRPVGNNPWRLSAINQV
jgi:predicted lipid-binding transport protein (Tim44 family)